MITMIHFLVLSTLACMIGGIVLTKLHHYKKAAFIILLYVWIWGFLVTGLAVSITSSKITPYIAFGIKRAFDEKITVVDWHQRTILFSNGQKIAEGEWFILFVPAIIVLLLIGGSVLCLLRLFVFSITKKVSLATYEQLLAIWPPPKAKTVMEETREQTISKKLAVSIRIIWSNFLIFLAFYLYYGRSALGTIPQEGYYYVGGNGIENPVSESLWLFSLFYTTVSICLMFLSLWLTMLSNKAGLRSSVKSSLLLSILTALAMTYLFYSLYYSLKAWANI